MRSTGLVLAGTLAAAIVAFLVWFLVPEHCDAPPQWDRANRVASHFAETKNRSATDSPRKPGENGAARDSCEAPESAGGSIRVRTCDEKGVPIAGAQVGLLKSAEPDRHGNVTAPAEFVDGASVTTDEAGECLLALPEASAIVELAATAAGFAPAFWTRARAGDEIRLDLCPTFEVTGFVRDRLGVPVAGASIRWHCDGRRRTSGETRSAADGSYRLGDVVEIRALLDWNDESLPWMEVEADGFAPLRFCFGNEMKRLDERHAQLDLWLMRGGRLRGRIVDRVTKVPVAGADVFIRGIDRPLPRPLRTRSGADGHFVLDAVPPFGVQNPFPVADQWDAGVLGDLCVVAAGRGSAWRRIVAPDDEEEVVRDFELPPVCDVSGRVVDERGAPIEGAHVTVSWSHEEPGPLRFDYEFRFDHDDAAANVLTDHDGRYSIHDTPIAAGPDASATIWAREMTVGNVTFAGAGAAVTLSAGDRIAAPDVVMPRFVEMPGRALHFVDEAGRDLPGAKFVVLTEAPDDPADLRYLGSDDDHADQAGRAVMPVSAAIGWGHWACLVARNEGFALAVVDLPDVPAETTIALQPEHVLRGVVHDVDGRPGFAEVSVPLTRIAHHQVHDTYGRASSSPKSGRFVVRGLPPGPWRVEALRRHDDGSEERTVLESVSEGDDLEIVLKGSGEPAPRPWWERGARSDPGSGRVVVALRFADSGRPVVHAVISVGPPRSVQTEARQVAPGRYVVENVRPGDGLLKVVVDHAVTATRPVSVAAGATAEVAVEIESGLALAGRVALEELPKSSWMEVVAIEAKSGEEKSCSIGSDGSFVLRGLDPDQRYRFALDYSVFHCNPERWPCREAPRSPADADADWRPRFEAPGSIVVKRRGDDLFFEGMVITILGAGDAEAGRYVASGLETSFMRQVLLGAYEVRLELPDGSTQEKQVTVAKAGETATIEIEEP